MRKHNKIFSIGFERLKAETGKDILDANDVMTYILEHPELKQDVDDIEDFANFIILQEIKDKMASISALLERL